MPLDAAPSSSPSVLSAPMAVREPEERGLPRFEEIYAEHFPFVWRSVRRLGVAAPMADDAVQEVFLVVHRRLGDFEGRSSFRCWLFGIVSRVASESRRTARRKDPRVRGGTDEPDVEKLADPNGPSPHDSVDRLDAARVLHDLLEELDWQKREVFVLVELEQMSIPEVAEALGVNANTVYSRLRAARRAFNQAVARYRARQQWRDR